MSGYLYYPGCSMSGSARAYAESLAAILAPLGMELHEIDDWNCCGASEYLSLGPLQARALVSRNLALAERQRNGSSTLVAPCSLCYVNLAKTDRYLRDDPTLKAKVDAALAAGGLRYDPGSVTVRHLFEVVVNDIGCDRVAEHVTRPLAGLRVVPYLGCLVSRPDPDARWTLKEQPRDFDQLIGALGAEVVDFPLRTDCCGGHLSQISPSMGLELIRRLIDLAERRGADVIATVCPMCQMNLDFYQPEVNRHFGVQHRMPVLFFTQLMGLAFGAAAKTLGIGSEVVSARDALAKIGVEVPVAEEPEPVGGGAGTAPRPRREKKPKGLPMPVMPGDREAER